MECEWVIFGILSLRTLPGFPTGIANIQLRLGLPLLLVAAKAWHLGKARQERSGVGQPETNCVEWLFRTKVSSLDVLLANGEEPIMNWHTHITVNPNICHGKACISGTRIPVAVILANLAAGASSETLRETYPVLTTDAILASLAYATDLASRDTFRLPD